MSDRSKPIEWNRLLVEGIVIVASILLAFAIDAWWDDRQERQAERRQLLSIAAELESNGARLQEKLDLLSVAEAAARELLLWMGPEPRAVQPQELTDMFAQMYAIGAFALLRGASEHYLSAGRAEDAGYDEVRESIADWYAAGDELERQYAWLREAHANVAEYLVDAVPMLYFNAAHPVLQGIQPSRFPLDPSVLLSDPEFESLVSLYLIRIKFVEGEATELMKGQAQLLELIRSAAAP